MSSSRRNSKLGNVAYMQDADDDTGSVVDGTDVTYAASQAPTSPSKERMNTSRKKSRRGDSSSPANGLTDSDSTVHPRRDSKLKSRDKEKDRSSSSAKKTVTYAPRPSTKHAKTTPVIQTTSSRRRSRDESTYYGIDSPTITSATTRPRASTSGPRPASYYGASSRPPPSNMRYYNMQQAAAALPPTSFPPQPWAAAGAVSYPVAHAPVPSSPMDYFAPRGQHHQQLLNRFSLNRPQSAMGHRAPAPIAYGEDYEPEQRGALTRRSSLQRKAKNDDDRVRMPPPPRPMSARPLSVRPSPFAPPPLPLTAGGFEDDAFEGDGTLYQDVSPLAPYDYSATRLAHRPRRPSVGATSIVYDAGPYSTEVAGGTGRRTSYFGGGGHSMSSGSAYEDKIRLANTYQEEVNGGSGMPLTAETLRKASKTSSRSTRSSASQDESDWRQSATTRTTRSSNEEDVTIRVKGTAVLKYGGAEMQCKDGAEINISSRGPGGGIRSGSDKSSYIDADERRTRVDRPTTRKRATSQAASHSRTTPGHHYGYSYDYTARPHITAPYNNWV